MRKIFISLTIIISILLTGCGILGESRSVVSENIEISIENITLSEKNGDISDIENAINEITVPLIGCKVKIVDCPIAEHEDLTKKISAGLTQVDIIQTGLTTSLSTLASEGLLCPLDNLLDTYGQELKTKVEKLLPSTTIAGVTYSIPANLYGASAQGIVYNNEIAEKYGIKVPDKPTLDDITEIGRLLKSSGSGVYLTAPSPRDITAFEYYHDVIRMDEDYSLGAIFNPVESSSIVNLFESEEYSSFCKYVKLWREEGLIPDDMLISGRNSQTMYNNGEIFLQGSSVSPGTVIANQKKNLPFDETYAAFTPSIISTSGTQSFCYGITSGCEYPEQAMELLNLIFTNGDLANLLQYGIEGVDYEKTGDTTIKNILDEDGHVRYSAYFSAFGDSKLKYSYDVDTEITIDDIVQHAADASIIKTFGYVFDISPVVMEVQKVKQVIDEYQPILETGMADDVDAFLAEFNEKLKEAGIDIIIAENQRQLDAWLAEK